MPDADLYLERIRYDRYLTRGLCERCGSRSCKELVDRVQKHRASLSDLAPLGNLAAGLEYAVDAARNLPQIPSVSLPQPGPPGLVELNHPGPGDPMLVTGNSIYTQEVLLSVLSTSANPFFVLFVDTRGDTLDMALILNSFTVERIQRSIQELELLTRIEKSTLIIPGLSEGLETELAETTGLPVEVGPVCAAELALFFGDRWIPA